jgi:hypothetical protein
METFPTTNWSNLTVGQRHDLKVQLANRCNEQSLPAPTMELIKALLGRLHGGVLNFESRTLFIKKSPITANTSKPTVRKPLGINMGRGRTGPENDRPPVGSKVDARSKGEGSKEPKKPELSDFIRKTPVGPKSTREEPVESWGHRTTLGEEPRTLPFIRKTLQRGNKDEYRAHKTGGLDQFRT